MTEDFEAGIRNCVATCARVERGQSVYIVAEEGFADAAVVEALTEAARDRGADVHVVPGPLIPKDRPKAIPPAVLDAYDRADVLFAHYPSLKREALHPHFPGESRVRVPNRARTVSLMSSEWAGFPYSVQRALATTLDTLSAPGKSWRITSPKGTDVRGRFGSRESTVAQAYFVEDEGGRARRNFPGGVHSPVVAVATEGAIVADHIAGYGSMPEPMRLELKDGRVVSFEGGDPEGSMHKSLTSTDGFIDSWHAGVNPKTIIPVARADNPGAWYSYSHCSPTIVHFHVGRSHAPVDVACFDQTIEIDGRVVYDQGKLTIWEEAEVDRAMNDSGMADSMMVNTPMTLG